jgi:hypothetical protein
MNRWMTAVAVAAGGGALVAMSAAHAAAFTPTPSTTAAVPASELGVDAPVQQQQKLPLTGDSAPQVWVLKALEAPRMIMPTGPIGPIQQLRAEAMLDAVPPQQTTAQQVVINPCPRLLATCTTQVLYIGKIKGYDVAAGTTQGLARAYPGEQSLDVADR